MNGASRDPDLDHDNISGVLRNTEAQLRNFEEHTQESDDAVFELSRILMDSSFQDSAANDTRIELLQLDEIVKDAELVGCPTEYPTNLPVWVLCKRIWQQE